MCTYSWSCASEGVSEVHHMYLLTVTCNKINELTCSIHNTTPLLKERCLHWLKCFETAVAKVRTRKVTRLLCRVHLGFERGILPTWQVCASNSALVPRCLLLLHSLSSVQGTWEYGQIVLSLLQYVLRTRQRCSVARLERLPQHWIESELRPVWYRRQWQPLDKVVVQELGNTQQWTANS